MHKVELRQASEELHDCMIDDTSTIVIVTLLDLVACH